MATAGQEPTSSGTPVLASAPRSGPSARTWLILVAVGVVVILLLALVITALVRGSARAGHTVAGPLGGTRQAQLVLVSGAPSVAVQARDLGGDLYRVSTPAGSSQVPKVLRSGGQVRVSLAASGAGGPASVRVLISSRVRWRVSVGGGANQETVDLGRATLDSVEMTAGADQVVLLLPRPDGTLPVRLDGGSNHVTIHVPTGVPARVRIGNGAGSVSLPGQTHSGVAPGQVFTGTGWDAAGQRYDIDATAGVSTLTVQEG